MLRTVKRLSALVPILLDRHEHDINLLERKIIDGPETGMERVKKMFKSNEYDEPSHELRSVVQSALTGFFVGASLGGFIKSRDAYLYFIENNQATIYSSTMQAKKKLQNYVTNAFARGAYHWGWRLGIFTGTFSLIATIVSVYRNETTLTQYILAGTITGAVYKANLGMAAMMVGAGLGAVLSTIGGAAIIGILKYTGLTMNDIRKAMSKINEARVEQFNQAKEKAAENKHDDVTRHHDLMVVTKGEVKIENIK